MPAHLLSKSKYIRGLQCERALWLDVFQPRVARYTKEQMRRFDRGREFEFSFKTKFDNAIDISTELGRNVDEYPILTSKILDQANETHTLFEAGFLYDEVLVLADVVKQREDGSLDIFEVKSGNTLSETYRHDAAVQYYVISNCRKVATFNIVHAAAQPTPEEEFTIIDLTEQLREQTYTVETNIAAMKEILSHGEPDTPTGQHCLVPYACPYQHYCSLGVRQLSLF